MLKGPTQDLIVLVLPYSHVGPSQLSELMGGRWGACAGPIALCGNPGCDVAAVDCLAKDEGRRGRSNLEVATGKGCPSVGACDLLEATVWLHLECLWGYFF